MHDPLNLRRVCAQWVPREMKDREKLNRSGLSLQHLSRYVYADGEDMLNRIVTGDESWMHHYQPESKRASMHGNISLMRKWLNGGAEVAETTVKRLLCFRFRRTGKAMGQVYQC
jgi:hypothetical protein